MPFQVRVHFDDSELVRDGDESTQEIEGDPGGIVGFRLNFLQGSTGCNPYIV